MPAKDFEQEYGPREEMPWLPEWTDGPGLERAIAAIVQVRLENGEAITRDQAREIASIWLDKAVEKLMGDFEYHALGPYGKFGTEYDDAVREVLR